MDSKIETPEQVVAELRAMSAQFVCPKDTYFAAMADVVQSLLESRNRHQIEAVRITAMHNAILNRLQWSNVGTGQAFIVKGVNDYRLHGFLFDAAKKAEEEFRDSERKGEA